MLIAAAPGPPLPGMRRVTGAIDNIRNGYAAVVGGLVKVSLASVLIVATVFAAVYFIFIHTPAGFLPEEDKGFLIAIYNLPPGASLNRTSAAAAKAEAIISKDSAVDGVVSVIGLDFLGGGTSPNAGVSFIRLKPYDQRTKPSMSAPAVARRLFGALTQISEGSFFAVNPPAISGIGRTGGFEYILEGLQGQEPAAMAAAMRGIVVAANQQPQLSRVFSTYEAATPEVRLDIDRDKVQTLGVGLSDVFSALQATLGGFYINDFNLFGRTWTVRLQAERKFRDTIKSIDAIQVRNSTGQMIPLPSWRAPASMSDRAPSCATTTIGPFRSTAARRPGFGDGDAIAAMQRVSQATLPSGYSYEWTGQALEQKLAQGQTPLLIGFALVFSFLFLVGLYESWNVPIPVLLSVSVAILGAMAALWLTHLTFVLYVQIGIVVLIALAAKNSILITEFSLQRRAEGQSIRQSAVTGARQRFRPVMMTSLAFIAGISPLLHASGPGASSMFAVGLPVFAGMIAASFLGIFLIPMLYVTFQTLREGVSRHHHSEPEGDGDGSA